MTNILYSSKFKEFTYKNVSQIMDFSNHGIENIVGKGENDG